MKIKFNKSLLITTALLTSTLMITNAFAHIKHYGDKESYTQATGKTISTFHESPYIHKYMPKLPPVNVRLKGLDPLIEQPLTSIGTYGGQANITTMAPYMGQDTIGFMPLDMLLGLESDNNTIISGLAQSYKLSKDMKTMTFTLRKGIKWSDGVPVTSQELYNWYKYIVVGLKMSTDLNDFTFKVINSRVFSITLPHANSFMPNLFADFAGSQIVKPFHYIKHFLPQFNKHITAEAKKAGYKSAAMYAKAEVNSFKVATSSLKIRPNIPTLSAYVLTNKTNDHWTFTRNPYYWKVDTKGNQLPYIDKLQLKLMNSPEVLTAKIISGTVDYSNYNNQTSRITVFKQHEKKGHYKTYIWNSQSASQPVLGFNLAYNGPDKVGLKIIQDVRFRQAFSLMINRNNINDTLYYGKGLPSQMTAHNSSKYYKKAYADSYAQYDPKQANKLLDQMGLKWDKNHKFRVRPDGKTLRLLLHITVNNGSSNNLCYEMIQTFAQQVGLQIILKETEWTTLVHNRVDGNINLLDGGGGNGATDLLLWLHPTLFVPYSTNDITNLWSTNYARWLHANDRHIKLTGVEPPQYIKDLYNTHLKLLSTTDPEKRKIYIDKILKGQADNLFNIGIIANPPKPITARDNVINIDPHGFNGVDNKWGANYGPETKFFKRPLYKNQILH